VIVAAELTQHANDLQQLDPMLTATAATLDAAAIPQRPGTLLADSGYWTIANLTQLPDAPELLIPPARHGRQGKPRKTASRPRPEATAPRPDAGEAGQRRRQGSLRQAATDHRPVLGQIKEQQGHAGCCAGGLPPATPSGRSWAAPTTS